jgi:hypothetical protein
MGVTRAGQRNGDENEQSRHGTVAQSVTMDGAMSCKPETASETTEHAHAIRTISPFICGILTKARLVGVVLHRTFP